MENRARKTLFKIFALFAGILILSGVAFVVIGENPKKADTVKKLSSPDTVHIHVKEGGYFFESGEPVGEGLRLPQGHRVTLVLHYKYAEPRDKAPESGLSPVHQFTIAADGFRLVSEPLSPENPKVEMVLDVGRGGIKKYDWYCNINCPYMGILFKKIEVLDEKSVST